MAFLNFKSEYNPLPTHQVKKVEKPTYNGYDEILSCLKTESKLLVVDCYMGVYYNEIAEQLKKLNPALLICADEATISIDKIKETLKHHITDDRVFGVFSHHNLSDFFDADKIKSIQSKILNCNDLVIVYGVGASLLVPSDKPHTLVYADMPRWEIQMRYRDGSMANYLDNNFTEDVLRRYKRGYFMEWRWADKHKMAIFSQIDYMLDTTIKNQPKMVSASDYNNALQELCNTPFRLKPYFDPGVWGGQWMKEVCNLDPSKSNYAWSFDGVPEENSLLFNFNGTTIETPSINLVLLYPKKLLGEKVFARFGAEFPIRFDFLDTMQGQNLSLQVHPTAHYAYEKFGLKYTQDESYYILDASPDAHVYLGLKDNVDSNAMINDLKRGEKGEISFNAKEYINTFPAKKHDHFLIPAGTLHCSGSNSMVLEISATPYIFTFKLWDWDRVGLDGLPRPVHIDHGKNVIAWDRTTDWVKKNLVNNVTKLEETSDYTHEQTGLHEFEFIETHRYTIKTKVLIKTNHSVNMFNLVDGKEAVISSPTNAFAPFTIKYAETGIMPANVGEYYVEAKSGECMILIANVKE